MPSITISGDDLSVLGALTPPAIYFVPPVGVRLSLISQTPVSEADIAGATTIYCVPDNGNYLPVFDGSVVAPLQMSDQIPLTLDPNASDVGYHQSGKTFDVFTINNGGVPQSVTGPAWSTNFVRGSGAGTTELESFAGILVNKYPLVTARFGADSGNVVSVDARCATYIGSFGTTGNGQATDSKLKRLLFNAYNKTYRPMLRYETASQWVYNTNTVRSANGNADNQIEFLIGLPGTAVDATLNAMASCSAAGGSGAYSGIGLDSSTSWATDSLPCRLTLPTGQAPVPLIAFYRGFPGLGRHALTWLERGRGAVDTTWYGDSTATTDYRTGLIGGLLA